MKTLEDLYKENPQEYADFVAIANKEHRELLVIDDKLALSEPIEKELDYKALRAKEYPRLQEQFDLIWHAIDSGALDKASDFYKTLK